MATPDLPPPPDPPVDLAARVQELEARLSRRNAGRKPSKPTTADARLVARVLALGWTRARLLAHLGYKSTSANVLSRCNGADAVPLPEAIRQTLKRMAASEQGPPEG